MIGQGGGLWDGLEKAVTEVPTGQAKELPDDSGEWGRYCELPDDSGERGQRCELPDDSGEWNEGEALPEVNAEQSSPEEIAAQQNAEILAVKNGEILLDSDLKKGNFGEMATDQFLASLGYRRIALDAVTSCEDTGHRGIDGIYFNESGYPQYVILDAKFGEAQLHMTTDGKQMGKDWIDRRLDQAVGKEMADDIRMELLLNPENVGLYVARVKEDGSVSLHQLDGEANVIERDVKLHGT